MAGSFTAAQIYTLPSVPIGARGDLPKLPGLYCVIDGSGSIAYVGMSTSSIRMRCHSHHRKALFRGMRGGRIAYWISEANADLVTIERETIAHLAPLLNVQGVSVTDRSGRSDLPPSVTSGGLVKRSSSYDPDVLAWLEARGKRLDRTVDWQIRQILRAAKETEADELPAQAQPAGAAQ